MRKRFIFVLFIVLLMCCSVAGCAKTDSNDNENSLKKITIVNKFYEGFLGEAKEIEVNTYPKCDYSDLEFISDDDGLYFVGNIVSLNALGKHTITVRYGNACDSFSFFVYENDETEIIISGNHTMCKGELQTLFLKSNETYENDKILWSSRDESIVKIDENGNATAIEEGECIIVCKIQGTEKVGLFKINVVKFPENSDNIFISNSVESLRDGDIIEAYGIKFKVGYTAFFDIDIGLKSEGKNIYFDKGTFTDDFTIDRSGISFYGSNRNIDPQDSERAAETVLSGNITLNGGVKNIIFNGFTFQGKSQITLKSGVDNFEFSYNILNEVSADGVVKSSEDDISNVFIRNNYSDNYTGHRFLKFKNLSNLTATDNYISCSSSYDFLNISDYLAGEINISRNSYINAKQSFLYVKGVKEIDCTIECNYIDTVASTVVDFRDMKDSYGSARFSIRFNSFIKSGCDWAPIRIRTVDYNSDNSIFVDVSYNKFVDSCNNDNGDMRFMENPAFDAQIDPFKKIYTVGRNYYEVNGSAITELSDANFRNAAISYSIPFSAADICDKGIRIEAKYEGNGVLHIGERVRLEVDVISPKSDNKIEYESFDESIATVSEEGDVIGVSGGNTLIRIKFGELETEVGFTVIDQNSPLSEVLEYIAERNSGNVFHQEIKYIGSSARTPHDIYGAVNDYYAAELPEIIRNMIPADHDNAPRGKMKSVEFIVIHDTGSTAVNATAQTNSRWCTNPINDNSSWQYTVGNDGIYQQVEDDMVAWHAGDGVGWGKNTTVFYDTGIKYEGDRPVVTIGEDGYFYVNGQKSLVNSPRKADGTVEQRINRLGMVCVKGDNGNYMIPTTWISSGYGNVVCTRGGNLNGIGIEMAVNRGSDIYLTWQYTAKLTARLLVKFDLNPDRVTFHNNFSNKTCPNTTITNEVVDEFLDLVYAEYNVAKKFADYKISFVSNNPDIIDNSGRIVNPPDFTTNVSYTVIAEKNGLTESITLNCLVSGR